MTKVFVTLSERGLLKICTIGPLIFLVYINDIMNSEPLGYFVLFADDTNIFVEDANEKK